MYVRYDCQSCSSSAEQEKYIPCVRSRLSTWSRETGSVVPSRVRSPILHIRVESGAYLRDSPRFPQRRPHTLSPTISVGELQALHAGAARPPERKSTAPEGPDGEVLEAFLYGCATWTPLKGHYTKLRITHHRMLLRILGARRKSPNKRILSVKNAL